MTWRALILGSACAVLLAGFGFLNDSVFYLNFLVGNHFPISVFGALVVFTLAVNPLLGRLGRSWALKPAELAVIVALVLAACTIPGSGLMREFSQIIALPAHFNRQVSEWQETQVLKYAPEEMLAGGGEYDDAVLEGFLRGTTTRRGMIDPRTVPWRRWATPLATWLPLILLSFAGVLCISLIVHTQWSRRELLPYPIAGFASSLSSARPFGLATPLLRNRVFWTGFAIVFGIRILNGLSLWFPDRLVPVPMGFSFHSLAVLWPGIRNAGGWSHLFNVRLIPTVIAFSFFLAADVSLSLGLTQFVAIPILAVMAGFGLPARAGFTGDSVLSGQMFGSYLAMALIVLYVGRAYYISVARSAVWLGPRTGRRPEPHAVWALRVLVGCVAALVLLLSRLGLDWPIALLVVALMFMAFMVTARVNAECGLIHIEPNWHALGVLGGLFGVAALGPNVLVVVGLFCAMLMVDFRESLMPYVINGLKMCDESRVAPARIARYMAVVLIAGLVLAVVVVLSVNYSVGMPSQDPWGTYIMPRFAFDRAADAIYRLQGTGELDDAMACSGLARFARLSPDPGFLLAFGIGVALVLLVSWLRLRFARWPLHPVIFLTWCTYPLIVFCHSFLIGWAIKKAVVRIGGTALVRKATPLMVGVIAGDILGGLVFMAVGAVYYLVTGNKPIEYNIFPA